MPVDLPARYDAANAWGRDDGFLLRFVGAPPTRVHGLGCGTGRLTPPGGTTVDAWTELTAVRDGLVGFLHHTAVSAGRST
ncbi:hypothetical protein ACFFMM_17190 [Micromonospora chaiyaphumensis]|uniref:Uncharacterized protein n=1 Tax=Micromonospora chaiyaphumensis TaxID=307119 RepID=A0A1C4WPV3_9ACTN|nr:hypothetical protein [Micromonospora chaiyaphumensis]SCE98183.1 hypothetical protein GA0070214_104210 [Micromonospora chaiyaphumensis]